MHEARYLIEDQERGLPVIQAYDYDTKAIGNIMYGVQTKRISLIL